MSNAPQLPVIVCRCRRCQSVLEFPLSMAGAQTRCPQCYLRIVVPQQSQAAPNRGEYLLAGDGWPWAERAESHPFAVCRTCNTRFSTPPEWIGKEIACPECGRLAVVQAVTQAVKRKRPSAGEYKVWEDYDPGKAEAAARSEQLVRVYCRTCGTLMYAILEEAGQEIVCPDCGRATTVPPPSSPPHKTAADFRTPADQEYDFADWRWQDAPEQQNRPPLIPVICSTCNLRMYAYQWQVGRTIVCPDCYRATVVPELPGEASLIGATDSEAEPRSAEAIAGPVVRKRSSRTTLTGAATAGYPAAGGWIAFLTQPEVLRYWAGLTAALFVIALVWQAVSWFLVDAAHIGPSLILGGCCMIILLILLAMWAVVAGVSFLAIVCDTANSSPRINSLPGLMFLDWLADSLYLFVPLSVSASMAGIVALILPPIEAPNLPAAKLFVAVMPGWLVLPVLVLSALSGASPAHLISRDVLRSIRMTPVSWLKYYMTSLPLSWLMVTLFYSGFAAPSSEHWPIGTVVICAALTAAILVHARLLGLLGRAMIFANQQFAEAAEAD